MWCRRPWSRRMGDVVLWRLNRTMGAVPPGMLMPKVARLLVESREYRRLLQLHDYLACRMLRSKS